MKREQLFDELASLREPVNPIQARPAPHTERISAEMRRSFSAGPVGLCFFDAKLRYVQVKSFLDAIKGAHVGLCYFDAELRYVQINGFLAAINGLSPEEHIGKSVREVLPELAAAGVEKQLRGVLETGDPVIMGTVTAETPAHPGEEHTYVHDYHAIRSDEGENIGVICCVRDITPVILAEQERDDHIRQIEESNNLASGRELRALELQREINELCEQCGIEPRYDLSGGENTESTPKQS